MIKPSEHLTRVAAEIIEDEATTEEMHEAREKAHTGCEEL